jgi:truncated hemoglobin YjbI
MTSNADYWAHVSAAFVGTAIAISIMTTMALIAQLVMRKRAERAAQPQCDQANRATDEVEARQRDTDQRDERVDEGKLRVAVRRSASRHEQPDPVQARQVQADAAAVRRGEETRPIATVRREMARKMICEPPMVEGMTLFSYLKHHARGGEIPEQPWDSEHNGALAAITEALYTGVEHDRFVAPVFDGYDLHELRKHFVRALVTLTSKGLDVETADALGRAHAHLRIRPEQYDAVIGHFVQALKRFLPPQVFESVLGQLSPAVQALRTRIVTATGAA